MSIKSFLNLVQRMELFYMIDLLAELFESRTTIDLHVVDNSNNYDLGQPAYSLWWVCGYILLQLNTSMLALVPGIQLGN